MDKMKPGITIPLAQPEDLTGSPTDIDNMKIPVAHDGPADTEPDKTSGIALTILATIALIFTLQWAKEFFVPVIFGIFIAYTLNPLVIWLERIKIPRVIGATLVVLGLLGSASVVAISVYHEAQDILDEIPIVTYKLRSAIKSSNDGQVGALEKIHNMADTLRKAASASSDADTDAAPKKPEAAPATPGSNLNNWLWAGSLTAMGLVGQLTMVLFLAFFALLSGNTFKRKLVKLTGPSLSNKKITVHILDDINISIQRYMFMLLVTNALLALTTWIALHLIGLDNPGAWAVAAGMLHIIPYFGPLISALAMGFSAFLQFGSFSMMLLVTAVTLGISALIGTLVTTWMTGRIAKMNATAVFVALLFGGWLWGVWGLLLCVPLIVVVKVISSHIEGMESIAELLGE